MSPLTVFFFSLKFIWPKSNSFPSFFAADVHVGSYSSRPKTEWSFFGDLWWRLVYWGSLRPPLPPRRGTGKVWLQQHMAVTVRNPLIHHFFAVWGLYLQRLFFFLPPPSCFPFTCAQFRSALLFGYRWYYFVLNVASGQQALCARLVYNRRRMFFSFSFMMSFRAK